MKINDVIFKIKSQKKIKDIFILFSFVSLLFVVTLVTTIFYYLYTQINLSQKEIILSDLQNKASILSSTINLESYESMLQSDSETEGSEYQKIIAPLRKAHFSADGLRYVYTVYPSNIDGESKIFFGLDTALLIDSDKDGIIDHSDFRSEYNDAPQEILQAFNSGKTIFTQGPYQDKYGTFISAFVPLFNKEGKVFSVLGVDMLYTKYQETMDGYRDLIFKIYVTCIVLIFVFSLILYFSYNKISQYKIQEVSLKNEIKDQQNFFIQDYKMAEIGKMMAGITHEINNPLSIIKGFSEQGIKRIERGQIEPLTHRKSYESIKQSTERIMEVIRNMKSIVSRPIGTEEYFYFSANESVKNVLKAIKYKAISEKVTFKVNIDEGLLIFGNRSQLEQVFFNMLSNSVDAIASQSRPWISVEVTQDLDFVFFHFIDSGTGLTSEMYKKIEQGYYTSKTDGNGSGMGLLICKKILTNHEGQLIFQPDQNTHFIIKLQKNEAILKDKISA